MIRTFRCFLTSIGEGFIFAHDLRQLWQARIAKNQYFSVSEYYLPSCKKRDRQPNKQILRNRSEGCFLAWFCGTNLLKPARIQVVWFYIYIYIYIYMWIWKWKWKSNELLSWKKNKRWAWALALRFAVLYPV